MICLALSASFLSASEASLEFIILASGLRQIGVMIVNRHIMQRHINPVDQNDGPSIFNPGLSIEMISHLIAETKTHGQVITRPGRKVVRVLSFPDLIVGFCERDGVKTPTDRVKCVVRGTYIITAYPCK